MEDEIFKKCPIDKLKKDFVKLTKNLNDLSEVAKRLEDEYMEQYVFGDAWDEDIEVVTNALEIAEDLLQDIEEERDNISKCMEQAAIEWEENLEKCKAEEKEECTKIENLLKELKKVMSRD